MSFVYFIRPKDIAGPIKIGCSKDPVARLRTLMVWSPFPLEIAAACPGNQELEAALHGHFRDHRLHGEWFQPCEELLSTIKRISTGGKAFLDDGTMERAKSALRVASGAKSWATKRVKDAEKIARSVGVRIERPEHIRQAMAEYTGPDKPAPTAEHTALISLYVSELTEMIGDRVPPARRGHCVVLRAPFRGKAA